METNKDDLYITGTNLLSCEDVVLYLWKKCDKFSSPFKPEKAEKISDKVTFSDKLSGEMIKKRFKITGDDLRHMAIKKSQEYDVDMMEFTTFDASGNSLSSGNLVVFYRPIEKFYYVFLSKENDELQLMIKCIQKKKLFNAFPTETVTFF